MLEQLYRAAMKRTPVPLDDAQALQQAHPEGTLLGDLLAGVTIDADAFQISCALSPESVVLGLISSRPWEPNEGALADLLQANASLSAGAAAVWSFNQANGALMLTCTVDPGALLTAADSFENWLLAVAQCFVKSCALLRGADATAPTAQRAAELVAAALPVAEYRAQLAQDCSGPLGWDAELPRDLPAWMVGLEARWPGAQRVGGRLRWFWGDWTLEALPHRWAKIDEVELRLIDENPAALEPDRLLAALQGDGQLPEGASVVGSMIEAGRLIRIWRFPEYDEPLKTADALLEALQVYRS